jgi:hypothetical protein
VQTLLSQHTPPRAWISCDSARGGGNGGLHSAGLPRGDVRWQTGSGCCCEGPQECGERRQAGSGCCYCCDILLIFHYFLCSLRIGLLDAWMFFFSRAGLNQLLDAWM